MINIQFLSRRILIVATVACVCVSLAYAHIPIAPVESTPAAREMYTMRVPNEKKVNSTKVADEFPEGLDIYDFEFKPGWNIEFKKNHKGKIIGATWTGTPHPYAFIEFGMLGINPKEEKDLARLPSPVTKLKKPASAAALPAASK